MDIIQSEIVWKRKQARPHIDDMIDKFLKKMEMAIMNDLSFQLYRDKKDIGFGKPYATLNIDEVFRLYFAVGVADLFQFIAHLRDRSLDNLAYKVRLMFLMSFCKALPTLSGMAVAVPTEFYDQFLMILNGFQGEDLEALFKDGVEILHECGIDDVFV